MLKEVNITKRIIYLKIVSVNTIIAALPESGAAIAFNESGKKWNYSPKNYFQIISDSANYEEISLEQAQSVFCDILPDEVLLQKIERRMGGK